MIMTDFFDSNVALLQLKQIPTLLAAVLNHKNTLSYDPKDVTPNLIKCEGKVYSAKYSSEEIASFSSSVLNGSRLLCPRISNKSNTPSSPLSVLNESFDAEGCFVISALQFPPHDRQQPRAPLHWARTILCLGSASLVSLISADIPDYVTNIVIVEDSPEDLAVALSIADIKLIAQRFQELKVGLSFIIDTDLELLEHKIHDHLIYRNPLHLNGILLHKAINSSSGLSLIESWLKNPEGISQHVAGFFGGEVDEINQVIQSVYNHKLVSKRLLLKPDSFHAPVVLVASGPSLDSQLEWLRDNQNSLTIFAAGSALGSLMRNGIEPDACCFLERQSVVYHDIKELVDEGYNLTNIVLISSITVDPRICSYFTKVAFFHRPASTSLALFSPEYQYSLLQSGPHSVNAALEAALFIGVRKILCLGCDFGTSDKNYPRSSTAIGESPRSFPLPVRGRSGKTVFTNPELVYAKINFANALSYYKATAFSPPYGVQIDHLEVISDIESDSALSDFSSSKSLDIMTITSPNIVSSLDLINSINASKQHLFEFIDYLSSILQESSKWSLDSSRKLDLFFNRDESTYSPDQIFVSRLINYSAYIAIQPFHDAIGDNSELLKAKKLSLDNLSWLRNMYSSYLDLLSLILNDDSSGFSWSHVSSLMQKNLS